MASKFQTAQRAVGVMMSKARKDEPQQSKTWGSGQNKRDVLIWHNDEYHVSLNCWGMAEQHANGDYNYIFGLASSFLAEAG